MGNTWCVKADDEQNLIDAQESDITLDNVTDPNMLSASSLDNDGTRNV